MISTGTPMAEMIRAGDNWILNFTSEIRPCFCGGFLLGGIIPTQKIPIAIGRAVYNLKLL